jgi:hydroxymethylpyrimidine/phosphomethylpyrimidine kinase
MKQVVTIAGSDSGGGAGIQADLKSFHANGVFGCTVITAITAQNTLAVTQAYDLPAEIINAQIDAVFEDFEIAAVKTGMLSSTVIVDTVANKLEQWNPSNIVVDPVMISKSRFLLLQPDAVEKVKQRMFPLATVVTPNIYEAEHLTGLSIQSLDQAKEAAKHLMELGCGAVLIKGGHLESNQATDVLYDGAEIHVFSEERIDTENTHGTGCTYASAIAAHLAHDRSLVDAVAHAKRYITGAIHHSPDIGHGQGPLDHFFFIEK